MAQNAKTEEMRQFGQYLAEGGAMTVVNVDERVKDDLCDRLNEEQIMYLESDTINGETTLFVATGDRDYLKEIEIDVLKEKQREIHKDLEAFYKSNTSKSEIAATSDRQQPSKDVEYER